jgi:hypothetical protein
MVDSGAAYRKNIQGTVLPQIKNGNFQASQMTSLRSRSMTKLHKANTMARSKNFTPAGQV